MQFRDTENPFDARHYGYAPGGKGSNQAFAVAKTGSGTLYL